MAMRRNNVRNWSNSKANAEVNDNTIKETRIKEGSYVFTWVITNFNYNLPLKMEQCITSPYFRTSYGLYKLELYLLQKGTLVT